VNAKSEEAKDFDFSVSDIAVSGNVKFTWDVFYCANCDTETDVGVILEFAREMRRAERRELRGAVQQAQTGCAHRNRTEIDNRSRGFFGGIYMGKPMKCEDCGKQVQLTRGFRALGILCKSFTCILLFLALFAMSGEFNRHFPQFPEWTKWVVIGIVVLVVFLISHIEQTYVRRLDHWKDCRGG